MSQRVARRFMVSGLVQGVGFRFFSQRIAAKHQVTGYVRNLADGRVEALVEGPWPAVEAFKSDFTVGPMHARVESIEEIDVEPNGTYKTFLVER